MWKSLPSLLTGTARRAALAGAVFAGALTGGVLFLNPQLAPRAVAQVESITEALERRSPGEREVGELSKGKASTKALAEAPLTEALAPQQRALGKVFPQRPESLAQPLAFAGPELTNPGSLVPLSLVSGPPGLISIGDSVGSNFGPPGGGFAPPGGIGITLPGPGGGTIVPPPGGGTVTSPPPDVPAVPEPSTWVVLIVGFAFCAGAMRRRRSPNRFGQDQCARG